MGLRVVFDDIKAKLEAVTNDDGNRVFGTVDLNRGQMSQIKGFENTGQIITFPAIFFKPEELKQIPRPNNVYVTEMRIRVHVVTNNLVHVDPLDIFDLPELVDRTILNGKWEKTNLVSIVKGFDVMPELFDNNQVYEINYWVKYWNINAYSYRDYVDANDVDINPEAPVELGIDGYIDDSHGKPPSKNIQLDYILEFELN